MASSEYNPSDLTSVLRTLSSLSNSTSTANSGILNHGFRRAGEAADDDDSYEPSDAIPTSVAHTQHMHTTGHSIPPRRTPVDPAANPGSDKKPIDPSAITAWPAGLKYVMQTVSQNEALQHRIRRLIQSQHDHERQWWQGREALLKKQEARIEKKKELDRVLSSVGVPVDTTKVVSTAEENETELRIYDEKVYKASVQMMEAMTSELRGLGIPFFAIRRDLLVNHPVQPGSREDSGSERLAEHRFGDSAKQQEQPRQGPLTRDDLSALQRRMLDLLLDLCRE